MTALEKWFEKAIPAEDFVASMQTHRENLQSIYQQFRVPEEDRAFFDGLKSKGIRVIAITEDWCGDAMMNTPILMRIAEAAGMEIRMILRDQNLELMDQYLTNGTARSIPIFIFIDKNGEERAVWGPRAASVQEFADKIKEELLAKDDPHFAEEQKRVFGKITQTYTSDKRLWNEVYESLKNKLANI